GVGDDDTYAAQLRQHLGQRDVDVINAGVTGYTSHQVLALLRRVSPVLDLDVATFCVGWNDGNHRPLDDRQFERRLHASMAVERLLSTAGGAVPREDGGARNSNRTLQP